MNLAAPVEVILLVKIFSAVDTEFGSNINSFPLLHFLQLLLQGVSFVCDLGEQVFNFVQFGQRLLPNEDRFFSLLVEDQNLLPENSLVSFFLLPHFVHSLLDIPDYLILFFVLLCCLDNLLL